MHICLDGFIMNDLDILNKWADQWEKAQELGVFQNEKPQVSTTISGEVDFFGTVQDEGQDLSLTEGAYWKSFYNQMTGQPDVPVESVAVADPKKITKVLQNTPNPIRSSSVGMDQDITDPISTGTTYDVDDLQNLETLKLKLHDLLSKLNAYESRSEGSAKLVSQIEALQRQIDDFSSQLSGANGSAS